ncbi:MAG: hypothetical protein ACT4NL_14405 [Pseudomarimonas sp.]
MLSPYEAPESAEAARNAAKHMLTSAYEQGFFRRLLDQSGSPVLRIISGTEFAFNGYQDPVTTNWKYDASKPISPDAYNALVQELAEYAPQIDPSVVVCPGSAVVDTGQVRDGKRVIENRSLLMQGTNGLSGESATNNIVVFSKAMQSGIDLPPGQEQAFSMDPGTGPVLVSVPDFSGGRPGIMAAALCLDLVMLKKMTFPIEPQIVLNPSAGSPLDGPIGPAEVIVPDANRLPFNDEGAIYSKVYAPKTGLAALYPGLASFLSGIETVVGAGAIADAAQGFVAAVVLNPGEHFDTVRRIRPVDYRVIGNMVMTDPRPLPEISDQGTADFLGRMRVPDSHISIINPNGATISTGPGIPDAPGPNEGVEGFDPNKGEHLDRIIALAALIKSGRAAPPTEVPR